MNLATGGATPISMNFGFGSYNFTSGEFNYLGKKGNKWYENVGFGLGALGNLSDIARFVDNKINLERIRIDEMQNSAPNGVPDKSTFGKNLDGLTYSGPEKGGPMLMNSGNPYFGPIDNPNFVDALGYAHDIARSNLNSRGYLNLIRDEVGRGADWRFCYENYFLGTKNLFTQPQLSLVAYKNATFFLVNKSIIFYGYKYLRMTYGIH
jgi:hypothetical protein